MGGGLFVVFSGGGGGFRWWLVCRFRWWSVCGFRWGREVFRCVGGQFGEGSKGANVRVIEGEQMGKRWGGGGGELNGIF